MEIYTLDSNFQKNEVLDTFNSALWTERYTTIGDTKILVPHTKEMVELLKEGTFLGLKGTDRIMQLETQETENGILTVSGREITKILEERLYRANLQHGTAGQTVPMVQTAPGEIMATLVLPVTMHAGSWYVSSDPTTVDLGKQMIPNLTIGAWDAVDSPDIYTMELGYILPQIEQIAKTAEVGFAMYVESAGSSGYSLKFKTYRGLDRTSTQSANSLVRFSPSLDSLTNIKELRSITNYRTVAYAVLTNQIPYITQDGTDIETPEDRANSVPPGIAYSPGTENFVGFDRRVLMVPVDDINDDSFGDEMNTSVIRANLVSMLNQRAKDALANNNYTKVVDGEVVPQSEFQYGTHFNMGDVVELEGFSGTHQRARVTEYIRSQDATGERNYPTVSVIE